MTTFPRRTALGLALGATVLATIADTGTAFAASSAPNPVPVPLDGLFDNDGIDTATTHDGNFDGSGYTFPAEGLPSGPTTVDGVPFAFPTAAGKNNIVAMGQQIPLPKGRYVT